MPSFPLFNWLDSRAAGVLLHPTCLPGDQGIGTFDANAERFLDFLEAAGMRYWQICPLGPTGYGDSPYQCFSAFAGNPYLIDMHSLVALGFLSAGEISVLTRLDPRRVDYGALYQLKCPLLRQAFDRYLKAGSPPLGDETFGAFKKRQSSWLDPYAYFQALKEHHRGKSWMEWPSDTRNFASAIKSPLKAKLEPSTEAHRFYQYLFFVQWRRLRAAAERRHIAIIGDLPIFVASDSSDVWSHPELFELDSASGQLRAVARRPPRLFFKRWAALGKSPLYVGAPRCGPLCVVACAAARFV